jgi:hypothetical protein
MITVLQKDTCTMKIVLLFMLIIFTAVPAKGFVLRTTDSSCLIKWRIENIDIYLDSSLAQIGNIDKVADSVKNAFDDWIYFSELPFTVNLISRDCSPGASLAGQNTNCIYAASKTQKSEDAGATTSVTFDTSTGDIMDADIVLYKDAGSWTTDGKSGKIDVYSVMLHEVGHFLGLSHSILYNSSVMYPVAELNNIKDSLYDDDIWGAAALYDSSELPKENSSCTILQTGKRDSYTLTELIIYLFL